MSSQLKQIIDTLNLIPHIEGGYYKRTYQSSMEIHLKNGTRTIGSAIYYLLESSDFSCWHRLKSDEIWHHYYGETVIIHQLNDHGLFSFYLGNLLENPKAQPQCIIPAGTWFAAEVMTANSFALLGCSVTPGFDFSDFEIGKRHELLAQYPQHKELIVRLTREHN